MTATSKLQWKSVTPLEFRKHFQAQVTYSFLNVRTQVRLQFKDMVIVGRPYALRESGIFTTYTLDTRFGRIEFGGDGAEDSPTEWFIQKPDFLELPQNAGVIVECGNGHLYVRLGDDAWTFLTRPNGLPVHRGETNFRQTYTDAQVYRAKPRKIIFEGTQ